MSASISTTNRQNYDSWQHSPCAEISGAYLHGPYRVVSSKHTSQWSVSGTMAPLSRLTPPPSVQGNWQRSCLDVKNQSHPWLVHGECRTSGIVQNILKLMNPHETSCLGIILHAISSCGENQPCAELLQGTAFPSSPVSVVHCNSSVLFLWLVT